jgi:GNAT superfamily N-acetyltransferase
MTLPEPVAGVRWRAGRADDVDVLTGIQAAADLEDEPNHVVTRSDIAQLLDGIDPGTAVVLGERDGVPVAMGMLVRPGGGPVRVRGAVVPKARGLGIGRALLLQQIDRAGALQPGAPALGLRSIAGGGVAGLARRFGFHDERAFLTMRRDLGGPIAPVPLAAGLRALPLDAALDEPLRLVKNEVFRDHWNGLADSPEEWRSRVLGPGLDRRLSRIALDGRGGVAGFVVVRRTVEDPDRASIPLVGTTRPQRGRGIARALLTAVLQEAAGSGLREAELDVDASSPTGADHVYSAVGFEEIQRATIWQRALPAAGAAPG